MKKNGILIFIGIFLFANSIYGFSPNEEKQVAIMLKEFYIAYNTAWAKTELSGLKSRLDSLRQKYCTKKLRGKLEKNYDLSHDPIINDIYTEDLSSLDTLVVKKDNIRRNAYYVFYIAVVSDTGGNKKIHENVQIRLTVVKEGNIFKIDSVLDS